MPDITMCEGGGCDLKSTCYRHNAEPNPYRQSYFAEPPFKKKMGGTACECYWCDRKWEEKE